MPELSELFDQAKAQVDWSNEQAREAAIETLKKSWNPMYSALTNLGFGAAQAKLTKEVTDAKTAQQAAETKLAEESARHQQQLLDLQNKVPEVKTVNEQWEAKLNQLKEEHRKEKQKLIDRNRNTLLQRDQTALADMLVDLGVPKASARILARDQELLPSRADYDDNGSLSVRQAGQQIPFAPGIGQTHLSLLAEEIVARPEVKEILTSDVDRGSGVSGGSQPGSGDKAFYDSLRQKAKESSGEAHLKPLRERVGGR